MAEAPSFEADVIDSISDEHIDPRCDAACKKVLSCKEFAAPILKYVCTEYEGMETNVKAPSDDGYIQLIINLEAQNANRPGYSILKRALYYCSRMISDQFGTVFTGSDYGKIRKVYSIWVCLHPNKAYTDTIARFSVKKEIIHGETRLTLEEETKERENYDLINMTIVGLKDFEAAAQSEHPLIRMLSLIFTQELTAGQKKEMLENDYNIRMTENTKEAFEDMCDFSTGFYQDGLNKGVKQGRAEGIGIGVERGKLEEQANIIKKLLRQLDSSQISSMLDIPLDEVEKVKRSIAQN